VGLRRPRHPAAGFVAHRGRPDSFQAFDRSGELFEPEVVAGSSTALPSGTLSAGQQVTGTVAFDISRGGVTLLMSEDSSRTVTALRVPD
jgi:hypothetical protein